MEESHIWRTVYIATIFSLIVLGIAYYLISPKDSSLFSEEKTDKIAEFSKAQVGSKREGEMLWEFFAEKGWTSKDQETTNLQKISKGKIYQDGNLIVTDLTAPFSKTYRHSNIIEANGKIHAKVNFGRISKLPESSKNEWTDLRAESLKYIPSDKRSEINGNVLFYRKGLSIRTDNVVIDHHQRTAQLSGNTMVRRTDSELTADNIRYLMDEEKFEADSNTTLLINEKNRLTKIKAEHASFSSSANKDSHFSGNLELQQGSKFATAKEGIYLKPKKEFDLKDEVKVVFERGATLLKPSTAKQLKSPDGRELLSKKTTVTADQFVISTRSGDAKASGSVHVFQNQNEAKAEKAFYNDKDETITMHENVFLKKGDEWIRCRSIIISVKDESFNATGSVEAEFKL